MVLFKIMYVGFLHIVAYKTWPEYYLITFENHCLLRKIDINRHPYLCTLRLSYKIIHLGPKKCNKTEPSGPLRSLYVCLK